MKLVEGFSQAREALRHLRAQGAAYTLPAEGQRNEAKTVRAILKDVRQRGDEGLLRWCERLDGYRPSPIEVQVPPESEATALVTEGLFKALLLAARRVRSFHEACLPKEWSAPEQGYGQAVRPLERVGIYIPGGTAPYPSTVLMTAIPAKVAGVREVCIATPSKGGVPPVILAAAAIAGVERIFAVGGAQAIAAMAYGTESVPKVDKVCGPGNVYVTLAKRMVFGDVDIDGLYGPSETVLVADESASAEACAADLLAQAEHDSSATPIFITTSEALASQVQEHIARRLASLGRRPIIEAALKGQGLMLVAASLEEALELANEYAPEHLCLLVREPERWLPKVRNAGGVFLGEGSPEALGDYAVGPSHVMPTGGTARFRGALGVQDFVKLIPTFDMRNADISEAMAAGAAIARAEGLTAHAEAIELRSTAKARKGG